MYNVTNTFLENVKKSSRNIDVKVTIGDDITLTSDDVINFSIDSSIGNSDVFTIGSVSSSKLTLKALNNSKIPPSLVSIPICPYVSIEGEWVKLGTFYADSNSIKKTDQTIELQCNDVIVKAAEQEYITDIKFPTDSTTLVKDLKRYVTFKDTSQISNRKINKIESKSTVRTVLSELAVLSACSCMSDRDGKITFVRPTDSNFAINADNYIDFNLESDNTIKITKLVVEKGQEENGKKVSNVEYGNNVGKTISFKSDNITDSDTLKSIYDLQFPYEYVPYSIKLQGMPHLDCGDVITLTDKKNVVRKLCIVTSKLEFNGGLISEFSCKAPSSNSVSLGSVGGSIKEQLNKAKIDIIEAQEALIYKASIDDLKVTNEEVQNQKVHLSEIDKALIHKASIDDLTAEHLKFTYGTGGELTLQELLTNILSATDGHVLNLTSDNVVLANAMIKDAMIASVNAAKINAGSIDTSKVNIQSSDGNMLLKGSLLQFKDTNNKVRIQMGLDGNKVYSLKILDANGNIQFDTSGVTKAGLNNGIIDDSKVADNANINGKKIDINSLITEINAGTTTLKASKIYLDTQKQSLETAFNTMSNTVSDTAKKTETNTTKIEEQQGQIDTLVKNTTITENGKDVQLKDAYTALKQTVGEVSTKATKVETDFNNLQIGGTNLLRASTFQYTSIPSYANFEIATVNNINGSKLTNEGYNYTAKSDNGAINTSKGIKINSKDFGLKVGDTIAISCDLKGKFGSSNNGLCVMNATTSNSTFYAEISKGTPHETEITYWTRKGRTFKIPSDIKTEDDGSFYLNIFFGGGTGSEVNVYVRNVQIEHGTLITDYKENPLDIEERNNENIGKTVASTVTEYYVSTSNTSCTGGSWSTNSPTWSSGKYIWSRNKTTLRNNTVEYSNPVCVQGAKGETGSTGKGIKSVTAEYYMSTSKTTQSGGTWVTSCPAWRQDHYLWTRSKITYTDNTTAYTNASVDSSWEAVNNIQIGGRNLIRNADANAKNATAWGNTTLVTHNFYKNNTAKMFVIKTSSSSEKTSRSERFDIKPNTKYTFSFIGFTSSNVSSMDVHLLSRKKGETKDYTDVHTFIASRKLSPGHAEEVVVTFTTHQNIEEGYIRIDNNGSTDGKDCVLFFNEMQLEDGTKKTAFKLAPEDTQSQIDNVVSRVSTAEQKITPTAIVNAINTALTDSSGNSKIDTVSTVLDKDGLTVKNGALKIVNKDGEIVLDANKDNKGNLFINGEIDATTNKDNICSTVKLNNNMPPVELGLWNSSAWEKDKAGRITGLDLSHINANANGSDVGHVSIFTDSGQPNYNYLFTNKPLLVSTGDTNFTSADWANVSPMRIEGALDFSNPKKNLGQNNCIMCGNGDGATIDNYGISGTYNMAISAWQGLAFGSTCQTKQYQIGFAPSAVLNTRSGKLYLENGMHLALADMGSRVAETGYQKLNNGLIIQWGRIQTTQTNTQKEYGVTFPIEFPNCRCSIVATMSETDYNGCDWGTTVRTRNSNNWAEGKAKVNFIVRSIGSNAKPTVIDWIAIGY